MIYLDFHAKNNISYSSNIWTFNRIISDAFYVKSLLKRKSSYHFSKFETPIDATYRKMIALLS